MTTNFVFCTEPSEPLNALMQRAARRIDAAIEKLTKMGLTVIGIEFSSLSTPTIQVQVSPQLAKMVQEGEAVHYLAGGTGGERYQKGQFRIDDVRVIWVERGH